jgi:hypothetical protein
MSVNFDDWEKSVPYPLDEQERRLARAVWSAAIDRSADFIVDWGMRRHLASDITSAAATALMNSAERLDSGS